MRKDTVDRCFRTNAEGVRLYCDRYVVPDEQVEEMLRKNTAAFYTSLPLLTAGSIFILHLLGIDRLFYYLPLILISIATMSVSYWLYLGRNVRHLVRANSKVRFVERIDRLGDNNEGYRLWLLWLWGIAFCLGGVWMLAYDKNALIIGIFVSGFFGFASAVMTLALIRRFFKR